MMNNNTILVILVALAIVFYAAKIPAVSVVLLLMALLVFYRGYINAGREGFENMVDTPDVQPIQTNEVAYDKSNKDMNKIREYVPYTISPYLAVPYENKGIASADPSAIRQQSTGLKFAEKDANMNPFRDNIATPQACLEGNAMYSTNQGCVKLRPDQINYLSSRGRNMDAAASYI
jgi:hypothetical protein